jgi:hypothetical protein
MKNDNYAISVVIFSVIQVRAVAFQFWYLGLNETANRIAACIYELLEIAAGTLTTVCLSNCCRHFDNFVPIKLLQAL